MDARRAVGVLTTAAVGRLRTADARVDVAGQVANTFSVGWASVTVNEQVQSAPHDFAGAEKDRKRSVMWASSVVVQVHNNVGSGTVTIVSSNARSLAIDNVARLAIAAASVGGVASSLVDRAAFGAAWAADVDKKWGRRSVTKRS